MDGNGTLSRFGVNVSEDVDYRAACQLFDAMNAKKIAIDDEIARIEGISNSMPLPRVVDPVDEACSLQQGIPDAGHTEYRDRLPTLRKQSNTMRLALHQLVQKRDEAWSEAQRLVFAANAARYADAAQRMLTNVEECIALNAELFAEECRLYDLGIQEMPRVSFPDYGFNELLPEWRNRFEEQLRHMKATIARNS